MEQFWEIYDMIWGVGHDFFLSLTTILPLLYFIAGIIVNIYLYSTAQEIGVASNSCWVAEIAEALEDNSYLTMPTQFHLLGFLADSIMAACVLYVLSWIWTIIAIAGLIFLPMQLSRNYYIKKNQFISALKGK